jgi:hypothetical protein
MTASENSASCAPLVIFHSMNGTMHCDDGWAAACVAKMGISQGEPEFFPGIYGQEPPFEKIAGRVVYLLDFSYKRPEMLRIGRDAGYLVVLDHHKTAQAELAGLEDELMKDGWPEDGFGQYLNAPYVHFDMGRSGAILAWRYFFGNFSEPPELLKRVEDGDLWRWAYPDSKLVQAALRSYPQDFETWLGLFDRPIEELAAEGIAVRRFIERKVAEVLPNAREETLAGDQTQPHVLTVNCQAFLASEVAGALAERSDAGWACSYYDGRTHRHFSLRSRNGGPDVSEIAKRFGGGGHHGAAGFQTPLPG